MFMCPAVHIATRSYLRSSSTHVNYNEMMYGRNQKMLLMVLLLSSRRETT